MTPTLKPLALTAAAAISPSAAFAAAGSTWGNQMATLGQDMLNWGSVITMALYVCAGVFFIMFVVSLMGLGRRNGNSSVAGAALCLLASAAAASAPTIVQMTSQTVTGSAPSVTGSGTAPIQF